MTVTRAPQKHDWQITTPSAGTSGSFGGMIVAVCRACGLIRTTQLPNIGREGRIDLSGTCTPTDA
jgi:hypothetical protein